MVIKSTGKTKSKFQDQSFFDDFNWKNFNLGDIVWLEDYRGEIDRIAGIFVGTEIEPVIRLLPNRLGRLVARYNLETIINCNYAWRKYLI